VTPVNPVIGENAIEHVLQGTAAEVRGILDSEEREQDQHLDDLCTCEFAVGFLFESHLPFSDVYYSKNAHKPMYADSTATFRKKIVQFRNDLSIFAHARGIFVFRNTNILKINDIGNYFIDFYPSFFC
jgi:hypothetical protein